MALNAGRDRRTVYRCSYHIANTTRFKRHLFLDEKSIKAAEQAFLDAAINEGVRVEQVVVRASLVSMRLRIDPSIAPAQVFARIKFTASKNMRLHINELPKMIFAKTFMVTTYGTEDPLDLVEYIDDVKIKYSDSNRRLN